MDDSAQVRSVLFSFPPPSVPGQLALPLQFALPPPPQLPTSATPQQEIDALNEAVAQFMPRAIAGDTTACATIGALYDRIALIEGTHRHAAR